MPNFDLSFLFGITAVQVKKQIAHELFWWIFFACWHTRFYHYPGSHSLLAHQLSQSLQTNRDLTQITSPKIFHRLEATLQKPLSEQSFNFLKCLLNIDDWNRIWFSFYFVFLRIDSWFKEFQNTIRTHQSPSSADLKMFAAPCYGVWWVSKMGILHYMALQSNLSCPQNMRLYCIKQLLPKFNVKCPKYWPLLPNSNPPRFRCEMIF